MRQTISVVFPDQTCAATALRRLEMRGFNAEVAGAARSASVARSRIDATHRAAAAGHVLRAVTRLARLAAASVRSALAPAGAGPGEIVVKVHVDTALEAQAARELIRACGARPTDALGGGWRNGKR